MAYNKKEEFPKIENRIAAFAKALSHPARLAILKKLANENECICGKIVDIMPLSQSTVSQHLKELREAGLIQGEIEGASSKYCINWNILNKEIKEILDYFEQLKKKYSLTGCCK